jgi:hypothetical protein
MNNGITTRGDETLDASKTVRCDFCGEHSAHERFDELKFPYGPEGVILSAIVAVTECTVCEEAYAGEDAEIQRELAVRKHLHAIAERPLGDAIEEQDDIDVWKLAIRKDVEERAVPIHDDLVSVGEPGW